MVIKEDYIIDTSTTAEITVNRLARKARQSRVFSRSKRLKYGLGRLTSIFNWLSGSKVSADDALAISSKQVLKKSVAVATLMLSVTSVSAQSSFYDEAYPAAFLAGSANADSLIISDNDGYLTKINPQTGDSNREGMTDKASHVIASGETLSGIAVKYGISEQTIMWENNMGSRHNLRVGQTLSIPPVDGVTHKVKKGETLAKVASLYGIEEELIKKQNRLDDIYLFAGQELIIPGGKLIVPAVPKIVVQAPREGASRAESPTRAIELTSSDATPAVGKMFIFPTRGKITQFFHSGHYAYDIADSSRPPVWAAGGGTVVKVSTGTWGGGYGNHIIIDHGNGYQTLYGHLQSVAVNKGDYIAQGQPIGQMGNTGRVYGVTGIHLHFEVRHNGVKENPGNFF